MLQLIPFTSFEDVALCGVPFAAITLAAFLVDLAIVLCIALRRGDIGFRRVFACALAGFALSAVRVMALGPRGLSAFGVLAFAWYDLCLVVPIASVAVLIASRRGRGVDRPTRVAAWLGVASIGACVWMHWFEPHRLVVETVHVTVPAQRVGAAPVSIAVLTDLQTDAIGAFEHNVVDTLCALAPDVIVVPGDLFQGSHEQYARERGALVALLTQLANTAPTWLVFGDTDHDADFLALAHDSHCGVLANEATTLHVKDRVIALHGVLPFHTVLNGGRVDLASSGRLDEAFVRASEADASRDDIRIVLCHHGDLIGALSPHSRVDLVIAGHTHGGQVQLPWIGPLITASALPRDVAAGGLFEVWNRTRLYQCRGIGMERVQAPRIRFNCPPTIGLVVVEDDVEDSADSE